MRNEMLFCEDAWVYKYFGYIALKILKQIRKRRKMYLLISGFGLEAWGVVEGWTVGEAVVIMREKNPEN